MSTERDAGLRSPDREQAIRHRIAERTAGRIRTLEIEVLDDRVVIRGHAPSYYLKQLALQGVLDVIDSKEAGIVEFNVEVAASSPKSNPPRP
jgi:hypothetical protein